MEHPNGITRYDRSTKELEEFLLTSLIVAGTCAYEVRKMYMGCFLGPEGVESPFAYVRTLVESSTLRRKLEQYHISPSNQLEKAFFQLAYSGLDLHACSLEELERIHGIGYRSSRYFLVHTRPDQPYVVLDRHILDFLRDILGVADVPYSTPNKYKHYRELECRFLAHCRDLGRSVADVDQEIWTQYMQIQEELEKQSWQPCPCAQHEDQQHQSEPYQWQQYQREQYQREQYQRAARQAN